MTSSEPERTVRRRSRRAIEAAEIRAVCTLAAAAGSLIVVVYGDYPRAIYLMTVAIFLRVGGA